jgi:dolichyl-phosphate beta-glucosyltransferase
MPRNTQVAIVVPAFNEAARLVHRAVRLIDAAKSGAIDAETTELILVDDGSTDGTSLVATELLSPDFPRMRIVRLATNSGKGAAIRAGAASATSPVVVFMDADMAVDPSELPLLMKEIEHADVAIGSRSVVGSTVENANYQRVLMGRTFNRLVNSVTNVGIKDTQCGFKAFRTPVARLLFHLMVVDRFAFDVEVLCLAQRLGLKICEVPVQWQDVDGSTVRHISDSLSMALDVARLRWRKDRSAIPALIVGAAREERTSPGDRTLAEATATFRHTDPIFPLSHDRVLVLLPLCQPTEVHGTATRLCRTSANVTVQRRLISCAELTDMLPLSASRASYRNANEPENRSGRPERRRRTDLRHESGNDPLMSEGECLPSLRI